MSETSEIKWKKQKKGFEESLLYLKGRKSGAITSLLTPWDKVNDATVNGIEWHSTNVIGGRPGAGKTLFKDQLIKEAFRLNAAEKFRVLEFQLEMLQRAAAIRQYSSELGVTYKYLCSADGELSDIDFQRCVEYARETTGYPIDIVEEPCTVPEFVRIIEQYMKAHSAIETRTRKVKDEQGKEVDEEYKVIVYTKTVVTLDHSILLKRLSGQNRNDMLYDLGEALTYMKRKYPIIFIILSQLNRDINRIERNEEGKYGNYILDSDIFGADAMLQHADTLIGLDIPAKRKLRIYGPERYIIEDESILVMHFLKCRNGDVRMSFFKALFHNMKIEPGPIPAQQETRINTMS